MSGGFHHSWKVSPARAVSLQKQISSRIIEKPLHHPVRLIAGVDAALAPAKDKIVAVVVLLQLQDPWLPEQDALPSPDFTVLEQQHAWAELTFPYIPGLLSFREAPVVLRALKKLRHQPDLVILDAQGKAHPRRAGLASHVGLLTGLPCVGGAKSRLTGQHRQPGPAKGCSADLLDKDGQVIGRVLRTRRDVKCLYVSVGHLVSLDQAAAIVLALAHPYRLPQPTRLAHLLAAKLRLNPPN